MMKSYRTMSLRERGRLLMIDTAIEVTLAEGKLIELIEKCWIEDPRKRIDIFEAVRFLRTTLEENNKQGRRWIS